MFRHSYRGGVDRKVVERKEVRHSGDLQEASGVSVPRARRDTKLQPKPRSEWFVARSLPSATVTSSVVFFHKRPIRPLQCLC